MKKYLKPNKLLQQVYALLYLLQFTTTGQSCQYGLSLVTDRSGFRILQDSLLTDGGEFVSLEFNTLTRKVLIPTVGRLHAERYIVR
jgi:hypothetical protein